ncbi:hypothetical protein BpHYR1_049203 [Brachionus plicatilis]|uniref:Uncharacterized protein n=1 Tax=Brachionus plicatilis TaxID=10195 RepID=A0A3M7PHW1_BRAPC|nr:hypothetical protein BpHYR1_049203 [Brachionus plicatilis]
MCSILIFTSLKNLQLDANIINGTQNKKGKNIFISDRLCKKVFTDNLIFCSEINSFCRDYFMDMRLIRIYKQTDSFILN